MHRAAASLSPCAAVHSTVSCRYCNLSLQRRPWQETANRLNHHATVAKKLQEKVKATLAAAAAAKAQPHITKPHALGSVATAAAQQAAMSPRASPKVLPHAISGLKSSTTSVAQTVQQVTTTTSNRSRSPHRLHTPRAMQDIGQSCSSNSSISSTPTSNTVIKASCWQQSTCCVNIRV